MNKIIIAILATASMAFAAEGQAGKCGRFDADGDKSLDKTEWVDRAAARFDLLDTNKDGKVTREEAREGMKGRHEGRKERREERKDKE